MTMLHHYLVNQLVCCSACVAILVAVLVPLVCGVWRFLEATDPAIPASRWVLTAPLYRSCFQAWVDRAASNCGGRCDIVFIGDSILEGLNGEWCSYRLKFPGWQAVFHDYISGFWRSLVLAGASDQTQHTLKLLEATLPLLREPQIFFVMIGTNNIGPLGAFSAADTARGVRAVVDAIRAAHTHARVLVHSILPRSDIFCAASRLQCQDTIEAVNGQLEAFARDAGRGVKHVDCSGVFALDGGPLSRTLMLDGLHPNADGYRRWFVCLQPLLMHELGNGDVEGVDVID